MALKLSITETYRMNTEEEVKSFIEKIKEDAAPGGYELKSYSSTKKVKKQKGEIVDEGFLVKIEKAYADFWMEDMF